MQYEINLRGSIDRSNSNSYTLFDNPSFNENTLIWTKGALSTQYTKTHSGQLDAFERELKIENNQLYIDNIPRYTFSTPIAQPIKGKWRLLQNNTVIEEQGERSLHWAPSNMLINTNPDTGLLRLLIDGIERGPVNTRAEFFYDPSLNLILEIENGNQINRHYNIDTGQWADNTIQYCAINYNRIVFSEYQDQNVLTNGAKFFTIIADDSRRYEFFHNNFQSRIYSVSAGPGFFLEFEVTGNGDYWCWWYYDHWMQGFECTALKVSGNSYLPIDGTVTELSQQIDTYRNKISNIANGFSYTTGNFVVYNGASAGLCTDKYIITGPLTPFTILHSSYNFHLFGDENGNQYLVQIGSMVPPAIQKMSEYIWQCNDGAVIVSNPEGVEIQPPISINLSFMSPYVQRTTPRNANSISVLFSASNNANYEVTNLRSIGGISSTKTFNMNGISYSDLAVGGAASIGVWPGDYYFGQLSTGGSRYQFSNNGTSKYRNKNLLNLLYPNSTNVLFPLPCNVTRIRTRTPNVMFKWADFITATSIVNNNRTMLAYYLFSTFYGGETFFFLLNQYYLFDGENLYGSNSSPGNFAFNGSIAAVAEGLKFLSCDSHQAIFWSPVDHYLYNFSGDNQIRPFIDLSNTNVIDACYSPALDIHAFVTPDECLFLHKGQMSSIKGNWNSCDTTLKGIVLYNGPIGTTIDMFPVNGTDMTTILETNYLIIKESMLTEFSELFVRLRKRDNRYNKANVQLETSVLLTMDNELKKQQSYIVNFKEGKDYQVIKLPIASKGRALKLKLVSDNPIQINAISIEANVLSKTPIKSNSNQSSL